ncbi:MAG: ComEC/Rec2 family competence protein, partial [Gammaproteobacteria bacterium]
HLLAISGLHVGLAAGLGALLAGSAARRLRTGVPVADVAAAGALAAAVAYAGVAGWPVSARRAALMLGAGLLCLVTRRGAPGAVFALALVLVLAADPLAVLDPGLWLSFGAVAIIGWVLAGRVAAPPRARAVLRLQAALSLAMVSLAAPWFGQVSLVSPVANLLAVPWFSLVVVPTTLAGAAVINLWGPAGEILLQLAARATAVALPALEWLGGLPWAALPVPATPGWASVCAAAGVAWLCLPRPAPGRWLGACLLAPVLVGGNDGMARGEFEILVLDVGQGLSTVIRTARHTVLFDAGPRWPGGDAGRSTVVPALRALGVQRLDVLVLSHGDSDHAGGGGSVASAMAVDRIYGGEGVAAGGAIPCRRGDGWEADGVAFRFLGPGPGVQASRNDGSCVLRVAGAGGRVLFTGDVEARGEADLLEAGEPLASDLVLAPHHGSRSSSGSGLVSVTRPAWIVFAAGWNNRWGFPHREVVGRWQQAGALPAGTDRSGALRFRFSRSGPRPPESWRQRTCRAWRDCGPVARP